ncbi:hypothetical protein [Asticcacaulis sp. YBE204]|uniref:hypothetical protein n=1 Tax=Asticcacaulis sp. YBE204 TaxID=1282363 RepID=UPI0003C3AF75|nr:hypothetical protein [Asticcacaulis sp. YBE204]ESQ79739.1 hypothetical protein AEYBE204_07805 [Asticcacaulis sp. YBE204]
MGNRILTAIVIAGTGLSGAVYAETTTATPPAPEARYLQIHLNLPAGAKIRQSIRKTTRSDHNGQVKTAVYTGEFLNSLTPVKDGYRVVKAILKSDFQVTGATLSDDDTGLEKLMGVMADVGGVTYQTDVNLTPLSLYEWPKFRARLKVAMRKAGLMKARQADAFDALYGQVTPEMAAEMFLPEDAMLAIPHNLGLSLNNPYRLDSKIPGPLGDTLSASETLTLTKWDEAARTAQITYESGPTRKALDLYAVSVRPRLEQVARDEARRKRTAIQPVGEVRFTLSTRCLYTVSLDTGLVRQAECQSVRDIAIGTDVRSQREDWVMSESLSK